MRKIYTPHAYQPLITNHIIDVKRSVIWAGMGMGKTLGTLTALDALILAGESSPTLVLAPLRVAKSVWPEECKGWEHLRNLRVVPITGAEQDRLAALRCDSPVYSINYENVPWLVEHYGERWPFKHVVSDESTKLKSYRGSVQRSKNGIEFVRGGGGSRSRALGKIAHTKVERFTELTGTPAPNGLIDLWGQMWFIDAGARLGRTFESFKQRWFQASYDGYGSIPLPHAQEEIHDRLRDVCLTIDAKDYFNLDAPIISNIYVDLPLKARVAYKEMEKEMFTQIECHDIEVFNAAAKTQKLLQLASGAVYIDPAVDSDFHPKAKEFKEVHDVKIQALESIVSEANGSPVLVAYHFKSDLARLLKAFPSGRQLKGDKDIADWNKGLIPVLFAHPASAGHGLNLQHGGNTIVYFSHDWNLENRQQILERIGPLRQMQSGYQRPVFVYNIIARDTVDELVLERCETKAEVQDLLTQAMKRRKS